MPYIDVPIDTIPADLAEDAFAYLEEQVDGWLPSPGNLEAWLAEALSQIASELRALCALVPESVFEYFGESILGLAPSAATPATAYSTWTMTDSAGYTINAGALVAVTPAAQTDTYAFQVASAVTVPPGQTIALNVQLQAIEAGTDAKAPQRKKRLSRRARVREDGHARRADVGRHRRRADRRVSGSAVRSD